MSKNTQISELINYISVDGSGNVVFTTIPAAVSNTDKFLVSDAGTLKFRTAAQLLSDIGAQASGSYQAALSGTGFVKISGSTISYDNSTYLTTSSASSTYLPLVGGTLTGGLIGTTASFSSFITAQSTGGSGLRIYGSSGTNQWDIYLNSTNLRFSDNTGTGNVVFDRPISGTSATFSSTLKVGGATGNFLIDSYTTSKIGIRSWTDIAGITNNFFVQNNASFNYGILGVVSATGTSTGDVYGLGYSASAGTSMTPVLSWTSGGNVGIGNTNPGAKLQVQVDTNFTGGVNYTTPHLFIRSGASAASGNVTRLAMGIFDGAQVYLDTICTSEGGGAADLAIATRNVGAPTEKLRITAAGNVGIQNTDPQARLHIGAALLNSADATNGLILKQTSTNETTGIYLERSAERKGYYIYVGGSFDSLNFQRNNAGTKSDTLTLTRDGHVGINQQNPTGLGGPTFVVAGSGYPEVIVEKTGSNARKWGFTVGSDGSYLLRDYTSGANVFTVNTSGTPNFTNNITVGGNTVWTSANDGSGSGLDADLLDGRDSGGYMTQVQGGIEFLQGSYTGWYKLARSSQATNGAGGRGSFKIIVAQTGNYLVPSQDEIKGFKDWGTTLSITSIESTKESIFQNYRLTYDADYTYLEGYVSYYFGGNQSIVINSYVNGLNGLTWSPYTGTVQASSTSSGALSIGKVNNALTVPYLRSAGGIQFGSGTSTLNYYEEGTFSPTVSSSTFSSVSITFGRYVRIGNQVTVNCKWEVTVGSTGRKYFVFNLPFAFSIASGVSYTGSVSNYDSGISANSSNVGTTVRNSSSSDTQQYVEAVFTNTNNCSIHFSMTYFTF